MNLKEKNISRFNPPIYVKTPVETVSLVDVYNEIVGDSLKGITEQHRTIDNESEAKESKMNRFPWITPSGIFTYHKDAGLVLHNQSICMDYDKVEIDLNVAKQMLINDPYFHTLLLFVSPSGKGLKWFVNIDLERCDHKTWYKAIANYTRERYGLIADMSCESVSKASFLCHDPEAYVCSEFNFLMSMKKKVFNPCEWATKKGVVTKTEAPHQFSSPIMTGEVAKNVEEQVAKCVEEVVKRGIDLTYDYEDWLNILFALEEGLGERGRYYFDRLSSTCPKYNADTVNKYYDNCLKRNYCGDKVKIGTFFDYMKKAGIDIGAIARECKGPQTFSHYTQSAKNEEEALASFSHKRPTFSDRINKEDWHKLLKPLLDKGYSAEYMDMTFLALFLLASGIIPNVIGKYHKRIYSSNFYAFVIAPPASNKGDLTLLTNFTKPVEEEIRAEYEKDMEEYRQKSAQQQAKTLSDDTTTETVFAEPPYKCLFAPGDISASMLYETMGNNQKRGLILFETEADVITQACRNKEWGDYSTGLRKAFHHESIQFFRRANKERVEVREPRLSVLISGTPKQVGDLIPNSENGLFSRWAFYWMSQSLEWQDVFAEEEEDYASIIERMGKEYYEKVYRPLSKRSEPLLFKLTPEQQDAFNDYLAEMQEEQVALLGDDIVGTVRRLGLITFRLAMTLSVLRLTETDADIPTMKTLVCDERDFRIAMEMSDVLISHATSVFSNLLRQPQRRDFVAPETMNYAEKKVLEQLSTRFTRQEYLDVALKEGINAKSANRYLGNLVNKHNVAIRVRNGVYEMIE